MQLIFNFILKMLKVFHDEFINEKIKQKISQMRYVFNEIFSFNKIVKINNYYFV